MKIDFEKAEFARLNPLGYPVSSVREACSRRTGFQNVVAEPATSRAPENLVETQMTGAQQCVVAGPRAPSDVQSRGAPVSERGEGEGSTAARAECSERAVRCTRCTLLGPVVWRCQVLHNEVLSVSENVGIIPYLVASLSTI